MRAQPTTHQWVTTHQCVVTHSLGTLEDRQLQGEGVVQ